MKEIKICEYRNCNKELDESKRKDALFCCISCRKQEQTYRKRIKIKIEKYPDFYEILSKIEKNEKIGLTKKEKQNQYSKNKRNNDELFRIKHNIRNLIKNTFYYNGYSKKTKTYNILGCTFEDFKLHLENNFEPWMNWENYGKYNGELNYGWDIDHIVPISSAKNEDEIIKLNYYTNLQPLCSYTNRHIKRNKKL
jgi:hypothetical protein